MQIGDVSVTVAVVFAYAPNKSASRVRRAKIQNMKCKKMLSMQICEVFIAASSFLSCFLEDREF